MRSGGGTRPLLLCPPCVKNVRQNAALDSSSIQLLRKTHPTLAVWFRKKSRAYDAKSLSERLRDGFTGFCLRWPASLRFGDGCRSV